MLFIMKMAQHWNRGVGNLCPWKSFLFAQVLSSLSCCQVWLGIGWTRWHPDYLGMMLGMEISSTCSKNVCYLPGCASKGALLWLRVGLGEGERSFSGLNAVFALWLHFHKTVRAFISSSDTRGSYLTTCLEQLLCLMYAEKMCKTLCSVLSVQKHGTSASSCLFFFFQVQFRMVLNGISKL